MASAKDYARRVEADIKKLDATIDQFLDRIINSTSDSLINAYEQKITNLQIERAQALEQVAVYKKPTNDFEKSFRTALDFLTNPYRLWVSGAFEDKRTVLKLAFQEKLAYVRGEGFRTAKLAVPFKLINALPNSTVSKEGMVELSVQC